VLIVAAGWRLSALLFAGERTLLTLGYFKDGIVDSGERMTRAGVWLTQSAIFTRRK
jgi:hypothetical protein